MKATQKQHHTKAVLAFSGGLDTSFCVPYLIEKGYRVVTVTVNTGGFSAQQLKEIKSQAVKLGATKHYEIDAKKNLYDSYVSYIIKANYLKGGSYPACVGPERNIIAEAVAKIAQKEKSQVIVHGSTGAGNDQARFDLAFKALAPDATIIAPIRDEDLTREQESAFLAQHGVTISGKTKNYSINVGLIGTSISGKETIGSTDELPDNAFPSVKNIEKSAAKPLIITITFQKGLPVALNGKKMSGIEIVQILNTLGAAHGFGKDYHIGTTIIGIKGRIGFEAPGIKVLIKAHTELEKLTLTSRQLFWKSTLGTLYGDLIHEGLAYDPLIEDLQAFLDSENRYVEGEVTIKIHKGSLTISSIKSPYSLLNRALGTYGEKTGKWSGLDAKGFCKIYGMESANAFILHHKQSRIQNAPHAL